MRFRFLFIINYDYLFKWGMGAFFGEPSYDYQLKKMNES